MNTRPTTLEVNTTKLRSNIKNIKSYLPDKKIMAVVKANAYGHGSYEVAKICEQENISSLAVALVSEGIALRKKGISLPILVMGAVFDNEIDLAIEHNLILTAPSISKLESIANSAKKYNTKVLVHIKIDTGMGRIGIQWNRAEQIVDSMKNNKEWIVFDGIYSHFSSADVPADQLNDEQIERFKKTLNMFKKNRFEFTNVHMENTCMSFQKNDKLLNFSGVRIGIGLYGLANKKCVPAELILEEVSTWKTHVIYTKLLEAGLPIGYNHLYYTQKPSRIATLPIGYADGFRRTFKDLAHVSIQEKVYPIVGQICMDQIMINVDNDPIKVGDEVILAGVGGESWVSLAQKTNMSIYEIMCGISDRVPRVYTK